MSQQNHKTLSVLAVLTFFVLTAILFSQSNESSITINMRGYVDMRVSEIQRAVDKASTSLDARLGKIEDDVRMLRSSSDMAQGKASQNSVIAAMALAILSLLIQVVRIMVGYKKNKNGG